MSNQTAINIGIIASLVLPSESLCRRAAYEMQSPLVAALGISLFSSNSVPSPMKMVHARMYILVALGIAMHCFVPRDL